MNENHIHVLKQYLKGKKDNIYLILIPLREFILEKCEKYNLKEEEIKTLIIVLIRAIDTYSFEKNISFYKYIDLYIDITFDNKNIKKTEFEDEELINDLIDSLKGIQKKEKIKKYNI